MGEEETTPEWANHVRHLETDDLDGEVGRGAGIVARDHEHCCLNGNDRAESLGGSSKERDYDKERIVGEENSHPEGTNE